MRNGEYLTILMSQTLKILVILKLYKRMLVWFNLIFSKFPTDTPYMAVYKLKDYKKEQDEEFKMP